MPRKSRKSVKVTKHSKPKSQKKTKSVKSAKTVATIAKRVVINNQEMLRRETGVIKIQYLDGVNPTVTPPTTLFTGLPGRSSASVQINPLNYGWENDESSETKDHFTGKGIHPRFLKTKLLFKFPKGENAIQDAMRLQLVWGFVKLPFMYTPYTTPEADEATVTNLRDHVFNQVGREYDSPLDQLKFNIKRPNNYVVVGRRWIKPDRRHRIGAPQNLVEQMDGLPDPRSTGGPPQVKEVISWNMGKQWRLTKSGVLGEDDNVFWYNNEQYIPFFLIYSPDYCNVRQDPANYQGAQDPDPGQIKPGMECGGGATGQPVPQENRIQVEHNSCMWYNDA